MPANNSNTATPKKPASAGRFQSNSNVEALVLRRPQNGIGHSLLGSYIRLSGQVRNPEPSSRRPKPCQVARRLAGCVERPCRHALTLKMKSSCLVFAVFDFPSWSGGRGGSGGWVLWDAAYKGPSPLTTITRSSHAATNLEQGQGPTCFSESRIFRGRKI